MYDSNIIEFKRLVQEQYDNIAGIVVLKDDQISYENYFDGFNQNSTIHVASVTKSIISILIGIAIDKGAIQSIEEEVLVYFPDYKIKRGETTIQQITIQNLLTMTAPYKYKYEPYTKVYSSDDWTKSALELLGGKGEIGEFKYTTVGIQILSGLLIEATGKSVLEFAIENLFKPLGIKAPHNVKVDNKEDYLDFLKNKHISGWVVDPKGVNTSGWGLALTTRDIAKVGQLYLNKGNWDGKQIVQSKWINVSTKEQSRWKEQSYGYLWWIINDEDNNCYAALGDGGNVIYVAPKKKIVVAITSRFRPRTKDRIELIRKYILPLAESAF